MKLMRRNTRKIWYALCEGRGEPILDDDGYETGDHEMVYSDPVDLTCNVGAAESGMAWDRIFGVSDDYNKVIVTDKLDCPIRSDSVLWVEHEPAPDGSVPYDTTVWRVAKYLNHLAYAVKTVDVDG